MVANPQDSQTKLVLLSPVHDGKSEGCWTFKWRYHTNHKHCQADQLLTITVWEPRHILYQYIINRFGHTKCADWTWHPEFTDWIVVNISLPVAINDTGYRLTVEVNGEVTFNFANATMVQSTCNTTGKAQVSLFHRSCTKEFKKCQTVI